MQAEEIYSVDGLPSEWGGVVAIFVKGIAERTELRDGREGEYLNTLRDTNQREQFTIHAKLYSYALWEWSNESLPKKILDWALDNVRHAPQDDTFMRLSYLLIRREMMAWWDVRGRRRQTKENIRQSAFRLKDSIQPILHTAVKLNDFELFDHLVTEKRQGRGNKRPYELEYFLYSYWMVWSLWDGNPETTITNFKKRIGFTVRESNLKKRIKKLGLKPKAIKR
jgi:hypothetical protein